jgi:hypothetical protein
MLIAEIIMTVIAWRRGWRWKALLPVAVAIMFGICFEVTQVWCGPNKNFAAACFLVDFMAILALFQMLAHPKGTST